MFKYQLERIKDMYSGISDPDILDGIPVVTVAQSDIEWLIEQAERVQELEEHIDYLYDNNVHLKGDCRLQEQNKRYREALEFYARGKHVAYKLDETDDDLVVDYGETARKALEGEE